MQFLRIENIIVFKAVGNFHEKSHVPKSFRWLGEDVMTVREYVGPAERLGDRNGWAA